MHKYKAIKLGKLFSIEKTKSINKDKLTNVGKQKYDYITRTSLNNGIESVTGYVPNTEINPANCFSLGLLQMTLYYRDNPWYAGQFVRKIIPKRHLTKRQMLYMLVLIRKFKPKFLGVLIRDIDDEFNNSCVQLPVKENGDIDFDYMEQRIKELECERIKELSNYLSATGLDNYKLSEKDNNILGKDINTGKFIIGDLFNKVKLSHKKNFDKRIDTTTTKSKEFNLPLINAKMGNNGIMYYARREDFDSISKTIDIIQNGAIATGMVYVQPQDTGILWDAYLLQAKFDVDQRCKILFYVATSIRKAIKPIFNRERKATWSRVQKQSILLPVDEDGNIDFKYMIDYITAIEKITIKDVVQYKDKVIENTKKVIK